MRPLIEFFLVWVAVGAVVCILGSVVIWYIKWTKKDKWGPFVVALNRELARKTNQGWVAAIKIVLGNVIIWPLVLMVIGVILTMPEESKPMWEQIFHEVEEDRDEEGK